MFISASCDRDAFTKVKCARMIWIMCPQKSIFSAPEIICVQKSQNAIFLLLFFFAPFCSLKMNLNGSVRFSCRAPSLNASVQFEWRAHQPGPHLRAAELRSGRWPSLSGVKPAWTDTLRHLISSPHSWDGTLPTPCVKQFKPDSSSSPPKIFAGLLDSRSLLFSPHKHFATAQNPSLSWLLRANLRPPIVLWWYIFNPNPIWRVNKTSQMFYIFLAAVEMLRPDP